MQKNLYGKLGIEEFTTNVENTSDGTSLNAAMIALAQKFLWGWFWCSSEAERGFSLSSSSSQGFTKERTNEIVDDFQDFRSFAAQRARPST